MRLRAAKYNNSIWRMGMVLSCFRIFSLTALYTLSRAAFRKVTQPR